MDRVRVDPVGSGPRLGSVLVGPRPGRVVPSLDRVHPFPNRLPRWPVVPDESGWLLVPDAVEQVAVGRAVAAAQVLAAQPWKNRPVVVLPAVGLAAAAAVRGVVVVLVAAVLVFVPGLRELRPMEKPVAAADVRPVPALTDQAQVWVETAVAVSDG